MAGGFFALNGHAPGAIIAISHKAVNFMRFSFVKRWAGGFKGRGCLGARARRLCLNGPAPLCGAQDAAAPIRRGAGMAGGVGHKKMGR
jgi:hypothetical protein